MRKGTLYIKGEIFYLDLMDPSLKKNEITLNKFLTEVLELNSLQELYLAYNQED